MVAVCTWRSVAQCCERTRRERGKGKGGRGGWGGGRGGRGVGEDGEEEQRVFGLDVKTWFMDVHVTAHAHLAHAHIKLSWRMSTLSCLQPHVSDHTLPVLPGREASS